MKKRRIVFLIMLFVLFIGIVTPISALTVPTEGVFDRQQDIKNSSGIMTERRFFNKNVLVEKRLYTYSSANGYRMTTKHLYWSNGSTIERTRKYAYNSSGDIYNTNTTKFRSTSSVEMYLIYEANTTGNISEARYYDTTGTYYTYISYYKNGIVSSKNYWKGASPNRVERVANYNATGDQWTKSTDYYDYNNGKISQIANYSGKNPNIRLRVNNYRTDGTRDNEIYYNAGGIKEWYIVYGENNNRHDLTYYNEDGTKDREIRYHKNIPVWDYEIQYQKNNIRESVRYRSKDDIIIKLLQYYSTQDKIKSETTYDEYGERLFVRIYDEATGNIKSEEWYIGGVIDIVKYYDVQISGVTIRKIRYFKDGTHLRWDINYADGEKESVKLYDNKDNYQYKETYKYTEIDKELETRLINTQSSTATDIETDASYLGVFNNEALAKYITDNIESSVDATFAIEDVKIIKNISIENANELAQNYSLKPEQTDETLEELEEIGDVEDGQVEYQETGQTIENNEEVKEDISLSIFDTLDGVGYLTELESLVINKGSISTIPDEISNLKNIKSLNLSDNLIVESSIKLGDVKSLETIDLSNNKLTTTEKYFANLVNLESINLKGNPTILFFSQDLVNHKINDKLKNIEIDSNVNYKDSDIINYEYLYNLKDINTNEDTITIDNTLISKIYKEDFDLNHMDIILPNLTKNIIKDLNTKGIGQGKIEICFVDNNSEFDIKNENNDLLLDKSLYTCQKNKTFGINDNIDNANFSDTGTYVINVDVSNDKLKIEHSIILRKYDTSVEQQVTQLDAAPVDEDANRVETTIDLDDNDKTLVSQTELKDFSKEEKAFSQLEDLESQYNIAEMNGYAGAYLDDNKNIVIQFDENNSLLSSRSGRSNTSNNKIQFKKVDNSLESLENKSKEIVNKLDTINNSISISSEMNKLIVKVREEDYEKAKELLPLINGISENDYIIEISNDIELSKTAAKKVNMGTAYRRAGDSSGYATFGFRLKKKQYYCVKKKNGKCKRNNKGKIIYKYKWVWGATVPYHDERKVKTKYYSGGTYVGYKYKRAKSNDTDMVRFSLKRGIPQRAVSKYGGYTGAQSTNSKMVVENATVWKIYRSLYSDRVLVSGKISQTSVTAVTADNTVYDNIKVKIKNTHGDSGGPLVTKYNKKSYVIGTSHAGVTDKNNKSYSGEYSYYNKVSKSLNALKAVAY